MGRLAAVSFHGQTVMGGSDGQTPFPSTFTYSYDYTAGGLVTAKRLHLVLGSSMSPPDLEAATTPWAGRIR
jgi:hypothetical protein